MEHSLLHALQLGGVVLALGGAFFVLAILRPACSGSNLGLRESAFYHDLEQSLIRWIFWSAIFSAVATLLGLFVDVAEANYQTIFGGVSLREAWRFAHVTMVGRLTVARFAVLLCIAPAVRFGGKARWPLTALLAAAAAWLTSLVCHAAAQPTGRPLGVGLQLIHIAAASIWLGPLIHLLLVRRSIEAATDPVGSRLLAAAISRFSPIAFTAVILIFISGYIAAVRYLLTPMAVPTSAYGLTLTVKLTLMLPLLYAGWMNFRIIRPALIRNAESGNPQPPALLHRFTRLLELEVTAGILVVMVAGILASVSPPTDGAASRLTHQQSAALLSPDLPTISIVDPHKFVGAAERTVDDLRYAEFTHNWSGVFVILLGTCWLVQSQRGRPGAWAEKIWPFLLVPFALFIAYAADPEVWILKTVSYAQALADPTMAEHQLAAILVLVLVWLGWRDRNQPPDTRPLGYALPALMIVGSLLLLGHAHTVLTAPQDLTNLINVQHAIFGTFGLAAGILRWLELRGLFPVRLARFAWPGFVIALGLYMAFFYREVV